MLIQLPEMSEYSMKIERTRKNLIKRTFDRFHVLLFFQLSSIFIIKTTESAFC